MKFALKLPQLPAKAAKAAKPAALPADPDSPSFLAGLLERKRLMRVAVLLVVAGSAGQIMQILQARNAEGMRSAEAVQSQPEEIVALSGEAVPDLAPVAPTTQVSMTEPALDPVQPTAETPEAEPVAIAAIAVNPGPKTLTPPQAQAETEPVLAAATPETATSEASAAESTLTLVDPAELATPACPVTLDLAEVPGAMIGVTLIAPCAPNARVVLQHEGLAVTGVTTASGALFASLPAFSPDVSVQAVLADGSKVQAQLALPAAADFRRFGVQWQGDDAFQVNAYQGGAEFGGPGHIYGVQPGLASDEGGFLQILGDPAAPMPLLAEVYTFPADKTAVELVVESAVTDKTCGRELLAEIIAVQSSEVEVTDLTLAMPDCSAVGDFLVLNNLAQDMTLAAN